MERRTLLGVVASGALPVLAGCPGSNGGTGEDGGTNERQTPPGSQREFSLGETASFTSGDAKQLEFTPTAGRRETHIVSAPDPPRISAIAPDDPDNIFLFIEIELENAGSERVEVPSDIDLFAEEQQYDREEVTQMEDEPYASHTEVLPHGNKSGWIVFELPSAVTAGELVTAFGDQFSTKPAKWTLDIGEFSTTEYDYRGQSVGDEITFGTGATQYSMVVNGFREDEDPEGTGGPEEGNKFVFASISATNTGTTSVNLPKSNVMQLVTGQSRYDDTFFKYIDEKYEGGTVQAGRTREGEVVFEVPESASGYQLQLAITDTITATWA